MCVKSVFLLVLLLCGTANALDRNDSNPSNPEETPIETITIDETEIIIPIPEGFVPGHTTPRPAKKPPYIIELPAGLGTVTRYLEYRKIHDNPPTRVQIITIQVNGKDKGKSITQDEFLVRQVAMTTSFDGSVLGPGKEWKTFTGPERFGYTSFGYDANDSTTGEVSTVLHIKDKMVSVNYISVTRKKDMDWVKDSY